MAEPVSPETNPEGEGETDRKEKCNVSLHTSSVLIMLC